jgi:hypothetical protein
MSDLLEPMSGGVRNPLSIVPQSQTIGLPPEAKQTREQMSVAVVNNLENWNAGHAPRRRKRRRSRSWRVCMNEITPEM